MNTGGVITYFDTTTTMSTNTWYHAVGTWDGTTMRVYFNGAQENFAPKSGTITQYNDQSDIGFGSAGGGGNYWNGRLDEIHVSNIARSADWITTEYNNQNNPGTFYTIGAETPM
jgi:hypothetical protein